MRWLLVFALLFLFRSAHAASPSALAESLATQVLAECEASGAKTAAVSVAGAPGLEGVPALVAAARALEDRLFPEGGRLAAGAPDTADVVIALVLSRAGGRVVLGGGVRARAGRTGWVLASAPETPEWTPWLSGIAPPASDGAGFAWRRAMSLAGDVLDADGGDLDGDGIAELVAVTRDEAIVLRVSGGEATVVSRTALAPGAAAPVVTREPRAFVRVSPGAGGPGELLVRFSDERNGRVLVWDAATARLEERGGAERRGGSPPGGRTADQGRIEERGAAERDGIVLAARPTARGPDLVSAELAPGTNHFAEPPRVKRGSAWKTPSALGAWLDLRDADLTATARIAEAGLSFALLDADGSLRLLRNDFSEIARRPECGAAFALADWDGDGKADPLCAGAAPAGAGDSLSLATSAGARWTADVDGTVVAIAAGPQAQATAAIAFVRAPDGAPGTTLWLLTRSTPP